MVLPTNFDDTEHLQAVIRRYLNSQIKKDFADLNDANGNWEPGIGTSRSSMRKALTHEDTDSLIATGVRMTLYYFTYGKARQMQPGVFGVVVEQFDKSRKYRPQVTLGFQQKVSNINGAYQPEESEISFRLMNKTSATITQANITTLINKIKAEFGGATPYKWEKGKKLYYYVDQELGYQFQLLCKTELQAKDIINKVMDIQSHTPDFKKLKLNTATDEAATYPNTPGNISILGETLKLPRARPELDVYFRWATLVIQYRKKPLVLMDTVGKYGKVTV